MKRFDRYIVLKIVSGWHSLGWATPTVAEETRPDNVVLTLLLGKPIKKTHQENPSRKPIKKIGWKNLVRWECV